MRVYHCLIRYFIQICCTVDYVQELLYTGSPSRKNIYAYDYNGLLNMEAAVKICNNYFSLVNLVLICDTMMAAYVLIAMPVNATFRSALPNAIVDEYWELWSELQLCITDDRSCYEL